MTTIRTRPLKHNLLAASMSQSPSEARTIELACRLEKESSTWEVHDPSFQLTMDNDLVARAEDGITGKLYVSTEATGLSEAWSATKIKKMMANNRTIALDDTGLSESQAHAARSVLSSNISILTGGPGTGKTYTTNAIARSLRRAGLKVLYAAPTGTAAKRMSLSTGDEACTIHRLLGCKKEGKLWVFARDINSPLHCDVLILDEATMMDAYLFHSVLKALGSARLILIGDANQLPPVGPGSPFHSLIDVVKTARLTEVRRTDPDGPIGMACADIVNGVFPTQAKKGETGFFMVSKCANQIGPSIVKFAQRLSPGYVNNVLIMSPYNHSVELINRHFLEAATQEVIGPYPIMCTANDYEEEIFNGETGLADYWPSKSFHFEGREVRVTWRHVIAFARTPWKAQGGESDDVILHMPSISREGFLTRNVTYTAVSRGKRRVVVLGDISSFKNSLKEGSRDRRVCLLGKLVTGEVKVLR